MRIEDAKYGSMLVRRSDALRSRSHIVHSTMVQLALLVTRDDFDVFGRDCQRVEWTGAALVELSEVARLYGVSVRDVSRVDEGRLGCRRPVSENFGSCGTRARTSYATTSKPE